MVFIESSVESIQNQVFESEVVDLDGQTFIGCRFINCELRYSGGPFQFIDTLLSGCQWAFGGAARRTMEVLTQFNVSTEPQYDEPALASQTAPAWVN